MKKMKKVISLSLAAALMVASITGCGTAADNSSDSGKKDTTNTGSTGSKTDTEKKENYIIGGIGPVTGANASYGISVKQGATIAIEEINAAGGVKVGDKTMTLSLLFEDDEAAADKAVTAYNSLMDAGMNALLGCVTSGSCLSVADLTKEDGILMLTPSGSAKEITKNDNVFRICFTDPLQGETMAEHMVTDKGYKNIAVIYKNSDEYSTGIFKAFEAKVKELGATITTAEAFADGEDFNTQLTTIKGTNAEAIFAPLYATDASHVVTQAADLGLTLPLFGSDGWDGIIDRVTDTKLIEGASFLSPFFSGDPIAANFVKKYQDTYKATPDQFAADGYDGVYVIKAALEKAGTIESAAVIKAMTEIKVDGLTGGGNGIQFTADGEPQKGAMFITIKSGAYTLE